MKWLFVFKIVTKLDFGC